MKFTLTRSYGAKQIIDVPDLRSAVRRCYNIEGDLWSNDGSLIVSVLSRSEEANFKNLRDLGILADYNDKGRLVLKYMNESLNQGIIHMEVIPFERYEFACIQINLFDYVNPSIVKSYPSLDAALDAINQDYAPLYHEEHISIGYFSEEIGYTPLKLKILK
ncbi:hypothetical protein HGO21_16595 [Acinetobacter sp. CUI P1]|nr:hypothetical protein [Acinetobacter sp. CUI P1]